MKPLLSILIPTLPQRARSLDRLLRLLHRQTENKPVEISTDSRTGLSTGEKRNHLLGTATGTYVAFVDDDDLVSDDYVDKVLTALQQRPDCCSLNGIVHFDEKPSRPFSNSLNYIGWGEDSTGYYRTPNHLNAVRRDFAVRAGFPDVTVGEDHEYSRRLRPLLHTQVVIPGTLYHYFSEPKVRERAGNLKLLLKWPTRGRPELFERTFREGLRKLCGRNNDIQAVVSVDVDDPTSWKVKGLLSECEKVQVVAGESRSKVQAINAAIPKDDWDLLVLLADDMVPVAKDWDELIIVDYLRNFPRLDGVIDYADGYRGEPADPDEVSCITMPVMGRRWYEHRGHIYHPEYTSLWCDNELADVARRAGKAKRIPKLLIKHEWIGQNPDELLKRNESYFAADKAIYERRKAVGFPRGSSMSYSQNDEENQILREVGGSTGRLLDIGAYDGKTLSNTLRLIEMGWRAVLVEPAPDIFQALLKLHRGNANVTLVNAALGPKPGLARFNDSRGDAVGTLSDQHRDLWSAEVHSWDWYLTNVLTPERLFAHVGWSFDFVNLDVEGMNLQVFRAIDWGQLARHGLRLVCVEHEGNQEEMTTVLEAFGFQAFHQNAENLLLRKT